MWFIYTKQKYKCNTYTLEKNAKSNYKLISGVHFGMLFSYRCQVIQWPRFITCDGVATTKSHNQYRVYPPFAWRIRAERLSICSDCGWSEVIAEITNPNTQGRGVTRCRWACARFAVVPNSSNGRLRRLIIEALMLTFFAKSLSGILPWAS